MQAIGTNGGGYFGQPSGVRVIGLKKVEATSFAIEAAKRLKKLGVRKLGSPEALALLAALRVLGCRSEN